MVTHDPLPDVMADELQLIQLFQNLVGNGIKYHGTGSPPRARLRRQEGGKKWMFSVKDNGLGIDQQYFERIFGMFQRLHKREGVRRHRHRLGDLQEDRRAARRQYLGRIGTRAGFDLSLRLGGQRREIVKSSEGTPCPFMFFWSKTVPATSG